MRCPILCALILLPTLLSAQIRLVPRERLDSVRNPQTHPSELRFPERPIEMGTLSESGGVWTTTLRWQNGEQTPVVITAIRTTCGCLKADFSAEPLKRGEWGSIVLKYNPKGHPGAVDQRLFVYTSLSPQRPSAIVRLVGRVEPSADRSGDYAQACGPLLLRQIEIPYTGEREVRIACMNGGKSPLRITEDRLLPTHGVVVRTEPELLAPAEQGDLVITLPERPAFRADGTLPILLQGLELPPRMRTLRLKNNVQP